MKLNKIIRYILPELIIILTFMVVNKHYFGSGEVIIKSDGDGYYDYLLSTLIYHDINRKDFKENEKLLIYKRILKKDCYLKYKGYRVNKYPVGVAFITSPFFISANLISNKKSSESNFHESVYQKAIYGAALFYLFLTLVFLRQLLIFYEIKPRILFILQVLLVFGTNLSQYAYFDASFSHVYSLFAITAFLYYVKSFFINYRYKDFILAAFFFGLIFLIRNINIVILLFIPFLAGSTKSLKIGYNKLISFGIKSFASVIIVLFIVGIQITFWYLQTGDLLVYSYQGEGFNFLKPEIINILFSYRKGLFVYTPITFIALFGLFIFIQKKQYYQFWTWITFFAILVYLLSSWYYWSYGCSIGLRAFIDFYTLFFILLAILLNKLKPYLLYPILSILLLTIPLSFIYTKQYNSYILSWDSMNKENFWKIFLKDDAKYRGILWKKDYDLRKYKIVKVIEMNSIKVPPYKDSLIFIGNNSEFAHEDKIDLLQIRFETLFDEDNNARVLFILNKDSNNTPLVWDNRYLLEYITDDFNEWGKGYLNYGFESVIIPNHYNFEYIIQSREKEVYLKNFKAILYKKKE